MLVLCILIAITCHKRGYIAWISITCPAYQSVRYALIQSKRYSLLRSIWSGKCISLCHSCISHCLSQKCTRIYNATHAIFKMQNHLPSIISNFHILPYFDSVLYYMTQSDWFLSNRYHNKTEPDFHYIPYHCKTLCLYLAKHIDYN